MSNNKKVLVSNESPDLLELFNILLTDMGYEVKCVQTGGDVLEVAKAFAPDAILVDLVAGHMQNVAVLDQLRANPDTRSIPVVATSTSAQALAEAVASYNVRQVLPLPFDTDQMELRVKAAIEQAPLLALTPPLLRDVNPLFAEVAFGLAAQSRNMIIRWVQRVASIEPFRSRKLELASSIDGVPLLLHATIIALQSPDYRLIFHNNPSIRDTAVDHVALRKSQGLTLPDVIVEYQFLREEIRCEIAGILMHKTVSPLETLEIVTRKDFALDTILRMVTEAY